MSGSIRWERLWEESRERPLLSQNLLQRRYKSAIEGEISLKKHWCKSHTDPGCPSGSRRGSLGRRSPPSHYYPLSLLRESSTPEWKDGCGAASAHQCQTSERTNEGRKKVMVILPSTTYYASEDRERDSCGISGEFPPLTALSLQSVLTDRRAYP